MGDMIDRDAASQIIARVAAGRLRVKDAMQEIAALPAAPSHPLADDARRALEADDVHGWIKSLPAAPAEDVRAGALFDAIQEAMQAALALPEATTGKRATLQAIAKVRLIVRPALIPEAKP